MSEHDNVRTAAVELSCPDLNGAIEVFTRLGFGVETIVPADDPAIATIAGHGLRLRLIRAGEPTGGVLRLVCRDPAAISADRTLVVAGGIRIELVPEEPGLVVPELRPSFVVTRDHRDAWNVGRAGMHYRDLIPDRQGGRFIASHIRVPDGGPVPDYVHFHDVRFQMIYCYKGWVRLVYEDQGEPFVMKAGEYVLQPPKIRHRVLEASPGLEVVEIGSPAVHTTHGDSVMSLPTAVVRPERDFDGQRFTCAPASDATIAAATGGRASARVVSGTGRGAGECVHDAELLFGFVLAGTMTIRCNGAEEHVGAADSFVLPPERAFELTGGTPDLSWLEVALPASTARWPATPSRSSIESTAGERRSACPHTARRTS